MSMREFEHKYNFFEWLSHIDNVYYTDGRKNSLLKRLSESRQLTYKEKLKNDIKASLDTIGKNDCNCNLYLVVPCPICRVCYLWDSFVTKQKIKYKRWLKVQRPKH